MKQKQIHSGRWYFFARTVHDHRRHLIGSAVKVTGVIKGKIKGSNGSKSPDRYRLKSGEKVNASELELLNPCKWCKGEITKEPSVLNYMWFCSEKCLNDYVETYEYKAH